MATNDDFVRGFAACAATLARDHGKPSQAADILSMNGLALRDLKAAGVEEFDLAPLREELKLRARLDRISKRNAGGGK